MAVKIRLRREGKVHAPYYRIVVTDSRTKRDGRFIEQVGKYHPKEDPSYIEVNSERVQYWLSVGAQPSDPVRAILRKTGDWQKFKGEPPPEQPLLTPKPKRDRDEAFNEALKEAGGEPKDEATTPKKKSKKSAKKDDKAAADEAKADEESKAEDAKADEPKAEEPKADAEASAAEETPAEAGARAGDDDSAS